jgi:peroxiredoxin Q/BCP
VKLSDHAGKSAFLLAFYPADFTSGCTTELSEFRDKHEAFVKAGVQVYGVSVDPADKHKEFRASLSLPFPLLADVDGTLSRAYDSLREGDGSFRSARKLVLVGRDGKIAYRDERYEVGNEAEFAALVAAMEQLPAP